MFQTIPTVIPESTRAQRGATACPRSGKPCGMRPRPLAIARFAAARTNRGTLVGAAAVVLVLCGCSGGGHKTNSSAGATGDPTRIAGRYLITLGDSDLPSDAFGGTAVSDRKPGARDTLTVVSLPIREPVTPSAQAEVSNSGVSFPGCIALSPDGRFAYIVETRGPGPEGTGRMIESLPVGDKLTAVNLADPMSPKSIGSVYVGDEPCGVAVSPSGDLLAVTTRNPRNQLVMVPLTGGVPGEGSSWPLLGLDDDSAAPSSVAWHPTGRLLAVMLPDRGEVVFYSFARDADGALAIAAAGAAPLKVGRTPTFGVFTADGRHLVVLDANREGRGIAGTVPGGPGKVVTVAVSAELGAGAGPTATPTLAGTAAVGAGPVGLAISPDGSTLACVTMQPGASTGTGGAIALIGLDKDGSLESRAEYTLGAVPAGVSFDAAGRFVLVSQFGSMDPDAADGEVSFWRITGGRGQMGLEQQDFFVGIGSGPHGLLIVR